MGIYMEKKRKDHEKKIEVVRGRGTTGTFMRNINQVILS